MNWNESPLYLHLYVNAVVFLFVCAQKAHTPVLMIMETTYTFKKTLSVLCIVHVLFGHKVFNEDFQFFIVIFFATVSSPRWRLIQKYTGKFTDLIASVFAIF